MYTFTFTEICDEANNCTTINVLKNHNVYANDLVTKIAQMGFDPTFGARAMKRVIQDKVEDLIAKKMLRNEIQKKVPFEIKAEEIV